MIMNKLLSLFPFFFLISCSSSPLPKPTPSLTIVNQNSSFPIVEVSLAGYKFENLNITSGISKTFQLSNGIDGLWNTANIQIIISWCFYFLLLVIILIIDFIFEFVRTGTMDLGTPQEKEGVIENTYDNIFEIIK